MALDDDDRFLNNVGEILDTKAPDLSKTLNIAVIGKVSSGKSSLINGLLRRDRRTPIVQVGAKSGVTTTWQVVALDSATRLIDSPGLDDIIKENSEETRKLLEHIDVGLLVVTGSADASQKRHFDDLRRYCKNVFVALNKVDEWDRLAQSALAEVMEQWQQALGADAIYPTCTFGFDPDTRADIEPDLRGVNELRSAIDRFLEGEGKALLLHRHMGEKRAYAQKIILVALASTGAEAFIPGSAAYITATQAAAIISLYYLYTGRVLSKSSALGLLPVFAAEAVGANLFIFVKSFLPPTGILDAAAAGVAVTVTSAMLLTVNSILASGHELHEHERMRAQFAGLKRTIGSSVHNATMSDLKSPSFWKGIVRDLMYS